MVSCNADIAKEISKVVGIKRTTVLGFLKIITKFISHSVAGLALDYTDGKIDECQIDIPEIGTLVISNSGKDVSVKSFELNSDFKKYLNDAINLGVSQLCVESETEVIESIKERYNSLI